MAVWSSLSRAILGAGLSARVVSRQSIVQNVCSVRQMSSHRRFTVEPSRWQWQKCKDLLHFYIMVAAIPLGLISLYANIFIGPAQLAPIPEGYQPKEWEYYRHPISRFIKRYFQDTEQERYERHLHQLYEDYDLAEINRIEAEVRDLQSKRQDYQHWYYIPVDPKFAEIVQDDVLEQKLERDPPHSPYP